MLKIFYENCINFKINKHIYVGYSGGVDSSVLLNLCSNVLKNRDYVIRAININYMHNKDSNNWNVFCKTQCFKYKIPITTFFVKINKNKNLEQEFRIIRYKIFLNLLKKSMTLLLAHNSNDIVETFFLNLFRGCGITGGSSINNNFEYKKISIFRPMSDFNKEQILNYATQNNIDYITDFTNFDQKFNRNFLRYKLFNDINKKWNNFTKPVLRYIELSKCFNLYINYRCSFLLKKKINNFYLNLNIIKFLPQHIKVEIIKLFIKNKNVKPLSYKHINELNKMIISDKKKLYLKINDLIFYKNLNKLYIKKTKNFFLNFFFLKHSFFFLKKKNINLFNFDINNFFLKKISLNINKKKYLIIKYENFLIIISGIWKAKIYSKFLKEKIIIKILK